jgi:hypothetical protein
MAQRTSDFAFHLNTMLCSCSIHYLMQFSTKKKTGLDSISTIIN